MRVRRFPGRSTCALYAMATFAALLAAIPALAEPPAISDKRAQAQAVLAQIQRLDSDLEKSIESYNYAEIALRRTKGQLDVNTSSSGWRGAI